ncbi:ABC transporter permease [Tellurirhabdus bombi]|uniref:ABC transporter permease n=1 Tax=Tellurirhabdus bombi TaxID=2907205 RepID=UPI001F2B5290|nr:ABC transporter permease [Tellurirhabdus bombi]
MLRNYFTTAFRNLRRNWNYSVLNIAGLSLGLTCCLLLFVSIRYELSFDRHHSQADQTFRLVTHYQSANFDGFNVGMPMPVISALRSDFPELKKNVTLVTSLNNIVATKVNGQIKKFQEESDNLAFIEPEYFNIFDYTWLKGSPATSLQNPNSVVLTEAMAQKYFGSANPIGKILRVANRMDFTVTGLVATPPVTTDFPFGIMLSFASLKEYGPNTDWEDWHSSYSGAQIYMVLPKSLSAQQVEGQLVAFSQKYKSPEEAREETFELQPLKDIHFATKMSIYSERSVGKELIWAMGLIGLFILITACVNFINMATAQALRRAKEVGVRKVLGSSRMQLVRQFLGETAFLTSCALVLSLLLAQLSIPYVADLMNIKPESFSLTEPLVIGFLFLLACLTTLLAGFYPALVLSGYQPALALKGKLKTGKTGQLSLRRALIVLQFTISQTLVIGTIIVYNQMEYFRSADLGFTKEAIFTLPIPDKNSAKLSALKAKLATYPAIQSLSYGMSAPSANGNWKSSFRLGNADKEADFGVVMRPADTAYVRTYGLKLIAGRMYQSADTMREVIVNETFVERMNFKNPQQALGQLIRLGADSPKLPIVGVVKDFNTFSLHRKTEPCLLSSYRDNYSSLGVRLNTRSGGIGNLNQLISQIEKDWTATFPDHLFKYQFVDAQLAKFYESEERMFQLFKLLASIAIFIGCLGLYGVVAYMAEARTKEVGIRKVLGASVASIFGLFSLDFVKLVVIGFVLASPLAWYVMSDWLEDFAYKIDIKWWMFGLAGLLAVSIALLTVSFQSIRAATRNPVKSLRAE